MPRLEQRVGPLAGGMAQQTTETHGSTTWIDHLGRLFDFRTWPQAVVDCGKPKSGYPRNSGCPASLG
jgi:hypothetical protein